MHRCKLPYILLLKKVQLFKEKNFSGNLSCFPLQNVPSRNCILMGPACWLQVKADALSQAGGPTTPPGSPASELIWDESRELVAIPGAHPLQGSTCSAQADAFGTLMGSSGHVPDMRPSAARLGGHELA